MPFFEQCLVAFLVLWAVGSILFPFQVPGLHRWLVRCNGSRQFVLWKLFSPSQGWLRPGTMELHYRDRILLTGQMTDWETGPIGYCWSWHAAFWMPGRILAASVQNLARDVQMHARGEPPDLRQARHQAEILAAYLRRLRPPAPGTLREHRLVRRFASDNTGKLVLSFTSIFDAADT